MTNPQRDYFEGVEVRLNDDFVDGMNELFAQLAIAHGATPEQARTIATQAQGLFKYLSCNRSNSQKIAEHIRAAVRNRQGP